MVTGKAKSMNIKIEDINKWPNATFPECYVIKTKAFYKSFQIYEINDRTVGHK